MDSVSHHQGCFPRSHSPPARPLPAQTRKAPSGPEFHGSAWAPTPLWPGPSHAPAGPPGAPTARGRLFALSWGGLHGCQVQEPTGTCGASHTQHSGQHPPTALFTLDGPRVRSRTHTPLCVLVLNLIPVLPTGKLLSYSVPAAQRGCSFTHPSQEHRVLVGRLLQNWIKDLLSMALPIRTRPSFPLSQSLLSGSFHTPLILLHQRADRMKTTITEN